MLQAGAYTAGSCTCLSQAQTVPGNPPACSSITYDSNMADETLQGGCVRVVCHAGACCGLLWRGSRSGAGTGGQGSEEGQSIGCQTNVDTRSLLLQAVHGGTLQALSAHADAYGREEWGTSPFLPGHGQGHVLIVLSRVLSRTHGDASQRGAAAAQPIGVCALAVAAAAAGLPGLRPAWWVEERSAAPPQGVGMVGSAAAAAVRHCSSHSGGDLHPTARTQFISALN